MTVTHTKREKDLLQASRVFPVLIEERPQDVRLTLKEIQREGKGWVKRVDAGISALKKIDSAIAKKVASFLAAARSELDWGRRKTKFQIKGVSGHETKQVVQRMLSGLTPRERHIVCLRFGIGNGGKDHTIEEIGRSVGLPPEGVRQIVSKALTKMRKTKVAEKD